MEVFPKCFGRRFMQLNEMHLAANSRPAISLQKLALLKVTTILCNNKELLDLIVECNFFKNICHKLQPIPAQELASFRVKGNELISRISISTTLKEQFLELLWPVSYKIMLWVFVYARTIKRQFFKRFYWIDGGRIDNKRTIQHLLREKNISIRQRFILACSVCLNEEIREIWENMSLQDRMYLGTRNRKDICPLVLYWVHTLERSDIAFQEFLPGALKCALKLGLKDAFKYLFDSLSPDARSDMAVYYMKEFDRSMVHVRLTEDEVDIGYFTFFEMSDENQRLYFNNYPELMGSLLLHSSNFEYFLNYFLKILKCEISEFYLFRTSLKKYLTFLSILFHDYHYQIMKDFDCSDVLLEMWSMMPIELNCYLHLKLPCVLMLTALMRDNFPFLLEKGAHEKIAELILSAAKTKEFHRGKWDLLYFLIAENAVSIFTLKRWKECVLSNLCIEKKYPRTVFNNILRFVRKVLIRRKEINMMF